MSILKDYLKKAIDGEFSATQKYTEFADIAQNEGFSNIAYLFKALTAAENIHIKNHTNALKEEYQPEVEEFTRGTTIENVKDAMEAEFWESKTMYKNYLKEIKKDKKNPLLKVAQLSFEWARDVEYTHYQALKLALKYIEKGKDLDYSEIYVCKVCGDIIFTKPTEICPICGHDPAFYFKVKRN
ncbi:rubrerythrin family protein [Promethearchaeum syntrophicum]|uniref:Rubrerythrin family protein n=1 Tax=Promethearchaeum syntrophicum TaxID=2594042 RepID=A0A5B9DH93_9ARCH|nr:rubrerythrin family protein [Candidatus Prometheoarchaeum syntrophicum]QEE18130.1 Rubrerythrin [Candidatus Prometheoarchaeum syntrophicum]